MLESGTVTGTGRLQPQGSVDKMFLVDLKKKHLGDRLISR